MQRLGARWSDSRRLRRFLFNSFYFPLQRAGDYHLIGRKTARARFFGGQRGFELAIGEGRKQKGGQGGLRVLRPRLSMCVTRHGLVWGGEIPAKAPSHGWDDSRARRALTNKMAEGVDHSF